MKKKVAVAMGGYSNEYEVSLQSGKFITQHLNRALFEVYEVLISPEGWHVLNENGESFAIDKADFSTTIKGEKIRFDGVFNMIHGNPGENGLFQGYLETLGIPHTSSNFYPSALSFHKRDCKSVLANYNLEMAKSYFLQRGDQIKEEEIIKTVGLPCFVKANASGSSFGVSKVKKRTELKTAIKVAFEEDDEVLIESFLKGTEVDVGVIEYKGELIALPPTEIIPENEFFDYKAKYLGQSQEITPARLTEAQTTAVQKIAKQVFKILRLKGFARADFIFHKGRPHFMEVNTIPGMSIASIVPKQLKAAGIPYSDFFTDLINNTLL